MPIFWTNTKDEKVHGIFLQHPEPPPSHPTAPPTPTWKDFESWLLSDIFPFFSGFKKKNCVKSNTVTKFFLFFLIVTQEKKIKLNYFQEQYGDYFFLFFFMVTQEKKIKFFLKKSPLCATIRYQIHYYEAVVVGFRCKKIQSGKNSISTLP